MILNIDIMASAKMSRMLATQLNKVKFNKFLFHEVASVSDLTSFII